jgi:hypothetical protein
MRPELIDKTDKEIYNDYSDWARESLHYRNEAKLMQIVKDFVPWGKKKNL